MTAPEPEPFKLVPRCQRVLLALSFVLLPLWTISAQTGAPVLLSHPTSTRAIAFESLTFTAEPFTPTPTVRWASDNRTRIVVYALNLTLQSGELPTAVTATAEDANHQQHSFVVEYVGAVPEKPIISAVVMRLSDDLTDVGDVLLQIRYHERNSNRVRVGIGHVGGGLPDDVGSLPSLVPPYQLSGKVFVGGAGFAGATVTLSGAQNATTTTDQNGDFSFTISSAGSNFTVTANKQYYDFAPATQSVSVVANNLNIQFVGTRQAFSISGRVRDDAGNLIDGSLVSLRNELGGVIATTTTSSGGAYSFNPLMAGFAYSVAPATTPFLAYASQATGALDQNRVLDFNAVRRTYEIHGKVSESPIHPLQGITVTLTGSQTSNAVTDVDGNYSFPGLPAAGNYMVGPASGAVYSFGSQTFNNLHESQLVDFTGTLHHYTVSGSISKGGSAFAGITVSLSGPQPQTVTTDANGNYSFANLAAGETYGITPSRNNYTFAPATLDVASLTQNITGDFNGIVNLYSLSGRIVDAANNPIGGSTLSLTGLQNGATTSDVNGNYTFTVPAEGDYLITASKPYYVFTPATESFNDLGGSEIANFSAALRTFAISGRVTDPNGNGVFGIRMDITGFQSASVRTDHNGGYSLAVPATGGYSLAPFIEQDSYQFTPVNRSFSNLIADQTADFSGVLQPVPDPAFVLEFDGQPKTVDYGNFWQPYVDLGPFFWEFWAMPGNNAGGTYLLSDGYGGAHALLFGFLVNSNDPGRYFLSGNTWDGYVAGQHRIDFSSDDGPFANEWGHFAVGWDGHNIMTYFNGVPVGKVPFNGPRATPGFGGGGERLLIGGSDHSNLQGRIAQVRGYEGTNPLSSGLVSKTDFTFTPETVFAPGGNLVSHFFRSGPEAADLSNGYDGLVSIGNPHPGRLRGTTIGILYECDNCPPPIYVIDPTAPNFAQGTPSAPVGIPVPGAVPSGALVFDSFSRANSTYVFGGRGGLGTTEGGLSGTQLWRSGVDSSLPQPFGILNGRAVLLSQTPSVAWVPTGSSTGDLDVRVNRRPGNAHTGLDTGISFRVIDANNFFFAYTTGDASNSPSRILKIGYYQDGNRTDLASVPGLPDYLTLRVISQHDGSIKVYANLTLVYSGSNLLFANATGAGIFDDSAPSGLLKRWDNFTVFEINPGPLPGRRASARN